MADGEVARPSLPLRLITLLAVAHIGFSGLRLALTLQAVHLQASPFVVGLLMSLIMVVPMFVAVPIGRWADRVGFARPSLLGCTLLLLAGILAAIRPSLPVLGVASVLMGSGYMLAHVSVNNAIGTTATPQNRPQAFGLMATAFSISGLLGPMSVGFAIDYMNHAVAFVLAGLFPLCAAVLVVTGPQPHARPQSTEGTRNSRVMDLLRHPPLRAVFIVSAAASIGWDLFTFLVPLHGVRVGLSASSIGIIVGAFGVGAFATRLAIPWLMRNMNEWTMFSLVLGFTAACYVALPFCERMVTLLPLSLVLGMVLGCGQPLTMSLVHLTAPPTRSGEAVGVRSAITSVSQTLLPLLFGALGSAVGMVPMFWAAATVLASSSVYAGRRRLP